MSGPTRLVVVGASLAGLRAVEGARKAGHEGPVTLIGAEEHLPYDRPPLSKAYLEAGEEPPSVGYRTGDELAGLDVELRLGAPADALDTDAREVVVDGARVPYDGLVIATGAHARALPAVGELDGVHTLRTLDDALAVRSALDGGVRSVVVVGAGFIGSEVASGAVARGVPTTIVEASPTPLVRAVGGQMGATLTALHEARGTDLRCGASVAAIEGDGRVEHVVLADGTVLDADLVVVGVGASPATDWLEGSGLALDDGVVCDETLGAGPAGVYAAGDVARWPNPAHDGEPMRLEHWTSAAEQGATAARNALDPVNATPYATVPYFWSDWYGVRIQMVGIPRADEVEIVSGDPAEHRFVALYRRGDRLVGALTMDRPKEIMKYRAQIKKGAGWDEALEFAASREPAAVSA